MRTTKYSRISSYRHGLYFLTEVATHPRLRMYMYGLAHLYRTIFQTVGWMWKDVSTERCSLSLGMSLFRASPLAVSLWTIYLVVRPSHYPVVTVKQSKNGQWEGLATRLLTMNIFPFSFQHPNLVQLMGYCSTPPALIFPFMERLSLYHCLHAYKVKNEFPFMISTICLPSTAVGL